MTARQTGVLGALQGIPGARQVLCRVAEGVLALIPAADGATVDLIDDDGRLTVVCAVGSLGPVEGARLDVDHSISGLAFRTGAVVSTGEARLDRRVDVELARRAGMVSIVAVPLMRSGVSYGAVKVSAPSVGAFSVADEERCALLAEVLGLVASNAADLARVVAAFDTGPSVKGRSTDLSSGGSNVVASFVASLARTSSATRTEARQRIERVLAERDLTMVFQPIVDLHTGQMTAVEALARFPGPPSRPPDVWFAEAESVGLGVELELAAVAAACRAAGSLPGGIVLGINVGPETVTTAAFAEMVGQVGIDRLFVELTEHLRIDNYERLCAQISELRRRGLRLSIDDTGAGFASLRHVVKLSPEVIKLDRDLVAGIDTDPVRRALATALVTFAHDTGTLVVAEGIETVSELAAIERLGADFGQGYLLGRPAPLADTLAAAPLAEEIVRAMALSDEVAPT